MSTGSLLHRSVTYDDAPITVFDPPLVLDANDGLTYECTHNNYDRDVPLTFGFTSEDEMAIIMGYYYPTLQVLIPQVNERTIRKIVVPKRLVGKRSKSLSAYFLAAN